MKKFVIECSNCKKKMKIQNKPAKYKCPSCGTIHKIGRIKLIGISIKSFFTGIIDTIRVSKVEVQIILNTIVNHLRKYSFF